MSRPSRAPARSAPSRAPPLTSAPSLSRSAPSAVPFFWPLPYSSAPAVQNNFIAPPPYVPLCPLSPSAVPFPSLPSLSHPAPRRASQLTSACPSPGPPPPLQHHGPHCPEQLLLGSSRLWRLRHALLRRWLRLRLLPCVSAGRFLSFEIHAGKSRRVWPMQQLWANAVAVRYRRQARGLCRTRFQLAVHTSPAAAPEHAQPLPCRPQVWRGPGHHL